jgi:hypothetical protein
MTGKRKRYSAEFKARVALDALRGELTTAQLATKHGVQPPLSGPCKMLVQHGCGRLVCTGWTRAAARRHGRACHHNLRRWWPVAQGGVWAYGVVEQDLRTPTGPSFGSCCTRGIPGLGFRSPFMRRSRGQMALLSAAR